MNMHMVMAPPFGGLSHNQFQSVFSEADFFTHLSFITFTALNSRFNALCFHTLYYCSFTDIQLCHKKLIRTFNCSSMIVELTFENSEIRFLQHQR